MHPEHLKKWDKKQIEKSIEYIGENPVLSLQEIIDKAVEDNFPKITLSTLSSYLKNELITLKQVRLDIIDRNSTSTKSQRKDYYRSFLVNVSRTFVFIDEMGFSCSIQRNKGRSFRGKNCIRKGPLLRGPNFTLCMAVCKEVGIVHHSVNNTSYNGDMFNTKV